MPVDEGLWGLATTPTPEVSVEAAMSEAVEGLATLPGVASIMVVSDRGSVLYSWHKTDADRRRISVQGEDVLSLMEKGRELMVKTGAEGLEHVLAKGPGRLVIVRAVGKGFLIIVASEEANLAMLLIRVRDAAEALSRMLR